MTEAQTRDDQAAAFWRAAMVGPIWKGIFEAGFSERETVVLFWILHFSYGMGRLKVRLEGFEVNGQRFGRLDVLGNLCGISKGNVKEILERLLDARVILDGPKGSRADRRARDWSEIEFLPDASNWQMRPRVKLLDSNRKVLTERFLADLNADLVQQEFRGSLGRVIGLEDALADLSRESALDRMASPASGVSGAGGPSCEREDRIPTGLPPATPFPISEAPGARPATDSASDFVPKSGTGAVPKSGTGAVPKSGTGAVPKSGTGAVPKSGTEGHLAAQQAAQTLAIIGESEVFRNREQFVPESGTAPFKESFKEIQKFKSSETTESFKRSVPDSGTRKASKRTPREVEFIGLLEVALDASEMRNWGGWWTNAHRKSAEIAEAALKEIRRMQKEGDGFSKTAGACMQDLYYKWGGLYLREKWDERRSSRKARLARAKAGREGV